MNVITIELCPEDRARLDRLTEALERRSCESCVNSALSWAECIQSGSSVAAPAEAPKTAASAPNETPASPNTHPETNDAPWAESAPPPVPEVSLAEFQKALTLRCAESATMREKVRSLLHEYAEAASLVPAEKRAEVLARLAKL